MLLEKVNASGFPVAIDAKPKLIQAVALQHQRVPALILLPRWCERLNLFASRDDRLVGRIEFTEFADQAIRHLEGLGLVEHEVAQEGIEVAETLGRLGLVQQTQRHFALDAEQAAEPFAIGSKF